MSKFTVIRDTKEKVGAWYWDESDHCTGTVLKSLKTGDYTMEGYENIITVERKKSVSEFAMNITEDRFTRELQRLDTFPLPYIVCEFTLSEVLDFPKGANLPTKVKQNMKVTGQFILKRIHEIVIDHHINFMFCENRYNSWVFVNSLFKRVFNGEKTRS